MNLHGLRDVPGPRNDDSRNNLSVRRAQNQNMSMFDGLDPLTV